MLNIPNWMNQTLCLSSHEWVTQLPLSDSVAQPHLSIRFMSWSPSPLRKRSRLAGSMRQEHKPSKRFSIISCSSAVDGLWRLNTWEEMQGEKLVQMEPTGKSKRQGYQVKVIILQRAAAVTHRCPPSPPVVLCYLRRRNNQWMKFEVQENVM